jgi:hypothetical protein
MRWRAIASYEKPGVRALFADAVTGYVFAGEGQEFENEIVIVDDDESVREPTHWMPWPQAPKPYVERVQHGGRARYE